MQMERCGNARGSGRCRLGCTSICRHDGNSRVDRCHGDVSGSGLSLRGES